MCVHPFNDVVSRSVRNNGHWADCNELSFYCWNEHVNVHDANSVYLEIGANIVGTCVMEMLLGTNANIIAFEPHPMNIFVLQQTISKFDSSTLQDRVCLVPVGLGDKNKGSSTIFSANNNMVRIQSSV